MQKIQETLQSISIPTRGAWQNQAKLNVRQSDLVIYEILGSASKPSPKRETTATTEEITTNKTILTTPAEQPGEMTNYPPPLIQWGLLEDFLLAVQCQIPGRQVALCFGGKEIFEFLRNWERMANICRLSTATKIESVVDYCMRDMKNRVNALMSIAKREVRDEIQET